MATARRQLISLDATPYYHCTSRCVRQAYLCGTHQYTGQSYEHRRAWVESWLHKLSQAFCIDVVGYAVMPNHYHVILHANVPQWEALSDESVIDRYLMIHSQHALMSHYRDGGEVSASERQEIETTLISWRDTLINISRFIGFMNEKIARWANEEDQCKGRFWQGRFHSQALLDEDALLRCMSYVDLNPIRAGLAATPEESEYTSVKHRLDKRRQGQSDRLMAFLRSAPKSDPNPPLTKQPIPDESNAVLPITFPEYLELLDWTGRILREDKVGAIASSTPDILTRLGYTPDQWTTHLTASSQWQRKALGSTDRVRHYAKCVGQNWVWHPLAPPDS